MIHDLTRCDGCNYGLYSDGCRGGHLDSDEPCPHHTCATEDEVEEILAQQDVRLAVALKEVNGFDGVTAHEIVETVRAAGWGRAGEAG